MLGSTKAAIIAYNVGPGNYRKGRYQSTYWNSYKEHLDGYSNWYEAVASDNVEDSVGSDTSGSGVTAVGVDTPGIPVDADRSLLAEDGQSRPH